jgi:long-chain acyl-CoA synthetase
MRGIHHVAEAAPDRVALVHDGVRTTYGELDAAANRIAHALAGNGVGPRDRVGVMLHNRSELFATWNAIARLGALLIPIGYRAAEPEVAYLLDDSDATVFVHEGSTVAADAARAATRLRAVYAIDDSALSDQPTSPPRDDFLGATVVAMNYTSGTTGRPKGIVRAAPQPASEYVGNPFMRFWGFNSSDVHLLCGPAYHTAPGAYAQMHLMEGARVVIMTRWDADECLSLIERERVTNSHMVPANFVRLLEIEWNAYDRSSVRKILHAAAPCPPAVKRKIMQVFPPGTVWEYFGMSEGMGTVISPDDWSRKPGSVGRGFPGVDVKVMSEERRPCAPGEVGLVYVSSVPGYPKFRYHHAEDKTAAAWFDGYFTVGDLGWLDADGFLFIADRRVDLVISGGVNIYPAEVEQALAELPDVVDAAVFGLPDARMGQHVHAVVELRRDSTCDAASLRASLRGRLADFKIPRTIEFVAELPREPTGKIRKRQLRDTQVASSEQERQ